MTILQSNDKGEVLSWTCAGTEGEIWKAAII